MLWQHYLECKWIIFTLDSLVPQWLCFWWGIVKASCHLDHFGVKISQLISINYHHRCRRSYYLLKIYKRCWIHVRAINNWTTGNDSVPAPSHCRQQCQHGRWQDWNSSGTSKMTFQLLIYFVLFLFCKYFAFANTYINFGRVRVLLILFCEFNFCNFFL